VHGGNIPAGSHPDPAPDKLPRSLLRPDRPPRPHLLIGHRDISGRSAPLAPVARNSDFPVAPDPEPDEISPPHTSVNKPANEVAHPPIIAD